MLEKFFSTKTNSSSSSSSSWETDLSIATQSDPLILISGPPSSGKTSLLFQYAFNSAAAAAASGDNRPPPVVFICNRRILETKPPYLSQGVDPSSHVFQHIQMKYVDDIEGLNNYFAAFHLHDTFPVSIIIDDFGDLFDDRYCQGRYINPRGRDLTIVKTLALCHNAIIHAKDPNESETGPCKLLLSDTRHGELPRLLYIYKRWVSYIYTVKGDGSGSFFLKKNIYLDPTNLELQRMRTAKYSIALQYLVWEGINEDMESNKHL